MFMTTKTITVMEDAYNLIKSRKKPNESFSDVLRRELSGSKMPLTDFAGKWGFLNDEDIEKMKSAIRKSREYSFRYRKEKLNL